MDAKFKILLGVFILLLCVWLGLSVYNKYRKNSAVIPPPINHPPAGQLPQSAAKSEEERIKSLAEDFARRYGTYTLGDFSGLESLKGEMTARLWQEKSDWINVKKQELESQPKRYITFSAFVKKSDILSFVADREADVEVGYIQTETKGATIQGEITIKYVNEFGEEKPIPPPIEIFKKLRLKIIMENNQWKITEIEDIK